jgi:hypothetical protein
VEITAFPLVMTPIFFALRETPLTLFQTLGCSGRCQSVARVSQIGTSDTTSCAVLGFEPGAAAR